MTFETPTPEMTPEEVIGAVEAGRDIHVLDVRAEHRLAAGKVDIVPEKSFHNITGSRLLALEDVHEAGLDPAHPLLVVCGVGSDSRKIAGYLNGKGYQAASLTGGISAWMNATVARELETPPELDHFWQFDRVGKGSLGYLLVSDGEALIVDPPRKTIHHLEVADRATAKVVAIADTHAHADYISGGPLLALACDAPYHLHPLDSVYPYDGTPGKIAFSPAEEGGSIRFGRAEVTIEHTPGHTEGSVTYRLGGHFALTGDFVFVNSVGRPDLGGKTEEWTGVLWRSMERARREWPADLKIYPAHYASEAERGADHVVSARFGDLPARNEPMAFETEAQFREWVMSRAGSFPEVYRRIKAINVGLETVDDFEADELEAGKNECALG